MSNNNRSFKKITLVSVTGLPDARGAAMALQHSQAQMPGARALLCSPQAPANLAPGIAHVPIASLNYHEYGWFMMFALWRVVQTEFALVVQEDGWVVNADNWRDEFLDFDYIGAPIHLAKIDTPEGTYWRNRFEWADELQKPGHVVTPIQNGGFSLRSRRFMRALVDHPHIRVEIPPPDAVEGDPLKMHWQHNALLEDVQLSGVLRPALEAVGMRFAPLEMARSFSIEHAGPQLHHGYNAMLLFGHHAKVRQLASLSPLTLRSLIPLSQLDAWYGERDILQMFERNGYRIEFAPEPVAPDAAPRRVYDCALYNGEADVLAIRLHELDEVVDWFVIVEGTRTFSGLEKPVSFDPSDPRIARFLPRIRHVVVDDLPLEGDAWSRETFQRNAVLRGLHDAGPDDLILMCDVDEIPRATVVKRMRDERTLDTYGFVLDMYYFYANYCNVEGPEAVAVWGVAATGARLATTTPDRLRYEVSRGAVPACIIRGAGWHLSFLMDDAAVRRKIGAFSHQEYNTAAFLESMDIPALVAAGGDLFSRPGFVWRIVERENAPVWLLSQPSLSHLFIEPAA
ncbi:hypothetical protein NU688_25100 [Variovorax sp. ZS18.2.2]|uniref:DUF5672 family protein n=1 Tax=Variovorax sp. ZS18.2.2 TaxID=2971255 RepID=UPI0021518C09|nr:DUF5672 family protein [Variovorax sp. ZS18.2.2]MCR6479460.1 hypothetical protein [Variovorax sp. ZS18.2.2]